jgi:uncharacterized protein YeaC (DUF1315 family)
MNFDDLIKSISPEIYENLKRAVELGKWPDGNKLTDQQRDSCMQAIIAWETKNIADSTQHTGYVPPKQGPSESPRKAEESAEADKPAPIKWLN